MLYTQRVNLFGIKGGVVPATCALYHDVYFFINNLGVCLKILGVGSGGSEWLVGSPDS